MKSKEKKESLKKLSVVIPCYGSRNYIESVVSDIEKAIVDCGRFDYEIILISDASPDNVFEIVKNMAEKNSKIRGIEFARNFGQHAALMAGYRMATGDYIVSMDDDGQVAATGIPKLVDKLEEGYDVVFAKYEKVKQSLARKIFSGINRSMMISLLSMPKSVHITSFCIYRRFVIEEMIRYETPFPYIAGIIFSITKNIGNVDIKHKERISGRSQYSFTKLLSLWMNGFTAFSVKPLRIATFLGVCFALVGFIDALYLVIRKILSPDVLVGYTSTTALILIIGGIIMLILGMIGEYIGRMYISINRIPQYVIKSDTDSEENER